MTSYEENNVKYASDDQGFTPPSTVDELITLLEPYRDRHICVDAGQHGLMKIGDLILHDPHPTSVAKIAGEFVVSPNGLIILDCVL